jgi:hypothetical protein
METVLLIKFKSMVSQKRKEEVMKYITSCMEEHKIILLDDSCDYEIVNFERSTNNDKE